ncbi:hypothetical protein VPH35_008117 [Triticum aestivum]
MDLCEKKRSSQGANYRREDLLGKKEERRRAKVKKRQIREGVKIPSAAPFPNRAWHLISLPRSLSSPPPAATTARPAWWCASHLITHLHPPLHHHLHPSAPCHPTPPPRTTSTTPHPPHATHQTEGRRCLIHRAPDAGASFFNLLLLLPHLRCCCPCSSCAHVAAPLNPSYCCS